MGARTPLALTDLTLPRRDDENPPKISPPASPAVLVCEDDDDTRETVAALLTQQGATVLQAATGSAALELARTADLSAVVLDIVLPDCTGFEICQRLRQDPRTRRVPVVMMTALTDLAHESAAILAGADAYLVKPVRRDELTRRLRKVI